MIKRCILLLLLLTAILPAVAEEMDMIVLLDVSESMFPYFDDTVNFLLKDIVDEHLEYGDGFHLLSFSSVPEQEIHRVIKSEKDIEASLARIMLLHPLGKYTDLISAMNYLYGYVRDLSLSTSKNILILTDGIHDPPPGSAYPAQGPDAREKNRAEAIRIAQELKREGWRVRLIEFPRNGNSGGTATADGTTAVDGSENADNSDESNDLYGPISETLGVDVIPYEKGNGISHTATGAPSLDFPDNLGRVGAEFTIPFTVTNYRDEPIIVHLEEIRTKEGNILIAPQQLRVDPAKKAVLNARVSLEGYENGEYAMGTELVFSDDLRIFPRKGELRFQLSHSNIVRFKVPFLIIVAAIALILLIIFTIIPLRRHIESNADADSAYGPKATRKERDETDSGRQIMESGMPTISGAPGKHGKTTNKPDATDTYIGPERLHSEQTPGSGKVSLMEVQTSRPGGKIPLSQISTIHHYDSHEEGFGHKPIEFRLSGQNPNNSGRNIRWVGKQIRTVGGGNSFFLVFLIKVPEKIAEVEFTESGLRFTPLHEEFFPDITKPVENCLNIPLRLHTEHGDFSMVFREWISPLERVNHILHLIDKPGMSNTI